MTPRRTRATARVQPRLARGASNPRNQGGGSRPVAGSPCAVGGSTGVPVPGSAPSPLDTRDEARRETAPGRNLETLPADLTLFDGDRCPVCAGPIERAATGRPPTFCSDACRNRAHRGATKPEVAPMATPTVSPGNSLGKTAAPKTLASLAAGIPTPADEYGPCTAYCEVREGGFGVVFGRSGGRVNEPAGPVYARPRAAIDLADLLNGRLATT